MISSWNMTIFKQVSLMYFKMIDHTVNLISMSFKQLYCGQKQKPAHGLLCFTAERFAFLFFLLN